ncbi:glycoside hydrolase family 38 N-terminal domain-containing protein [Paenibacillus eucommiae]|uniref:Alpha-mannosidase n=1 Tax=Paenibacillus eucommiae TaxID=1355755 RepID=A0ABS4J6Y8_9BACL|nr:alpha-mannosidase [Paenibacillus eucommiae]MBP1994544.1 alpha-mannosidase [Paenibacillus eucommiae]
MKKLHLLSNAHLDPVWQWEWEEGAAAAVSTFRAAAEFCEEYEGYVFNHNEVILYKWVEEYEPALFERIRQLVAKGKWNIMGGWYLQPDCNMPSGESFVRQILTGKSYFREKFGVEPTTAINFDSFGHTRGLVQILQQAGYDSYIFMRPNDFKGVSERDFIWSGFNGSEVMAHKIIGGYNTLLGQAHEKIREWLQENEEEKTGLILWGVGNHGGGPSRLDITKIGELMEQTESFEIVHSTPESYFQELKSMKELPRFEGDLNPFFVGCYTSLIRIKQLHRRLENELYMTEKMLSAAAMQGLLTYPSAELHEALCDLLTSQFHDILPGSCVQPAEEASLRLMEHGLEILARLKARAFFALAKGQPKAALKEYPILIYNPHPFPVRGIFECEFMLEDQNWKDQVSLPTVVQSGVEVPSQLEKEHSNLNLDWRKRVVFEAELAPSTMNRFDCRIDVLESKPAPLLKEEGGAFKFITQDLQVVINAKTGQIDEYAARGIPYFREGAFTPLVLDDIADSWKMDGHAFSPVSGRFELMDQEAGSRFSGVKQALPSVRVVEDGEIRTVIEALLHYNQSSICMTYKLPKKGTEIEVQLRVYWHEKDKMLKLSIPTWMRNGVYCGQTAFGISELADNGDETVSQKWVSVQSADSDQALTCINNGTYGSDYRDGEIRLSLLRSSAYCAHPIKERPIVPQDRFMPRMDQGERIYTFWVNGGKLAQRQEQVDREAVIHNERPYALSFFPSGDGVKGEPALILEDDIVQLSAFKKQENGDGYILRIFEPTGSARATAISIPVFGIRKEVQLNGFEFKTFELDPIMGSLTEVGMCER